MPDPNDREAKLRWLQAELEKGAASLDRGEYSTRSIEEIIADARSRHRAEAPRRVRKPT
jgi:hypothetical protein